MGEASREGVQQPRLYWFFDELVRMRVSVIERTLPVRRAACVERRESTWHPMAQLTGTAPAPH